MSGKITVEQATAEAAIRVLYQQPKEPFCREARALLRALVEQSEARDNETEGES